MNSIALVTTCLNEGDSIHLWMRDVEAQTVRPAEVVIVDAGSRDGTLASLLEWRLPGCEVRVEEVRGCSVARGRNRAISLARSDVIASTDTGCRLTPDWLERISAPLLAAGDVPDAVAGNYSADPETLTSAFAWADFFLKNAFRNELRNGFLPSSRSIAYRRSTWETLGGYPEDLRYAGDDTVFARQLYSNRMKVAFAPGAMVLWRRHREYRKYLKEAFNYGRGNGEAGLELGPICPLPEDASLARVKIWSAGRALDRAAARAVVDALRAGYWAAASRIPLLRAASVYQFNLGFRDGRRYGDAHCGQCRSRVRAAG